MNGTRVLIAEEFNVSLDHVFLRPDHSDQELEVHRNWVTQELEVIHEGCIGETEE